MLTVLSQVSTRSGLSWSSQASHSDYDAKADTNNVNIELVIREPSPSPTPAADDQQANTADPTDLWLDVVAEVRPIPSHTTYLALLIMSTRRQPMPARSLYKHSLRTRFRQ